MLDLRYPMGLMFAIVGGLLAVYGLLTGGAEIYQRSLGINVNLWWGLMLFVFGMLMFALASWKAAGEKDRDGPRL